MSKSKILFGYHANCFDGFGSYYYARSFFEKHHRDLEIDYRAMAYVPKEREVTQFHDKEKYPEGQLIIFADYCPSAEALIYLSVDNKNTVLILDHHHTAKEHVKDFPDFVGRADCGNVDVLLAAHGFWKGEAGSVSKVFDMQRSGTTVVFDWFNCNAQAQRRPALANYLEDRDLWKFVLPASKDVNAFIQSHEFTYENYDRLHHQLLTENGITLAKVSGAAITVATNKTVSTILTKGLKIVDVDDGVAIRKVGFFNTSSHWSEVGHTALDKYPSIDIACGLTFDFVKHEVMFSFRTRGDIDCSILAEKLGGGGHKPAAGCMQSIGNAMGFLTSRGVM